jgi:hypothetical protein
MGCSPIVGCPSSTCLATRCSTRGRHGHGSEWASHRARARGRAVRSRRRPRDSAPCDKNRTARATSPSPYRWAGRPARATPVSCYNATPPSVVRRTVSLCQADRALSLRCPRPIAEAAFWGMPREKARQLGKPSPVRAALLSAFTGVTVEVSPAVCNPCVTSRRW